MARAYATEHLAWFSRALFSARLVVTEACPTLAAVDTHLRVYFNPQLVSELIDEMGVVESLPQLAFVWVHEICHVVREHADRSGELNALAPRWNVAADLEINDSKWLGLEPPSQFPPLLPQDFGLPTGLLAEYYYHKLSDPEGDSQPALLAENARGIDEGSGVHGESRPWELTTTEGQHAGSTPLELDLLREYIAQSICQEKSRGTMPLGWIRWAEERLRPQVDWRRLLLRRVRGAVINGMGGRADYSFHKPHRRSTSYAPLILPSLCTDIVPRVACVVDTSGSISPMLLAQSMAEVRGVLASLRMPITVIPCDAVAYEPIEVLTNGDMFHLELQGGGGTDMRAGIRAAIALQPKPDAVIVLTDGYTPFPRKTYKVPVVFGIFKSVDNSLPPRPRMPPWRDRDVILIPGPCR
jgi:predicted metal-dependent peptidase